MENEESSLCVHLDYFDRLFIACIVCSMHVNTRMKTIINRNEPPADFYQLFSLFIFTHTHTHTISHHSPWTPAQCDGKRAEQFSYAKTIRVRRKRYICQNQSSLDDGDVVSTTAVRSLRYIRHLFATDPLLFAESVLQDFSSFLFFFFWLKMIIQFDFGHRCGWWRWNWYFDDILIVCCCVLIPSYM